jgi:hypothetical protein
VALEVALYAFGRSEEYASTSWLATMEAFAEAVADCPPVPEWTERYDIPPEVANRLPRDVGGQTDYWTFNTYNGEYPCLSQDVQGTGLGGPYSDYTMVSVHGGADIRGGYTAPRVYSVPPAEVMGSEAEFSCDRFDWVEYESCLWGSERLIYQPTIDPFELEDEGYIPEGDEEHPALQAAHEANESGEMDGAVFYHDEQRDDIGFVTLR